MSSRIAVIIFPGTNCDIEAVRALKRSDMNPEVIRWNENVDYSSFDGFYIPGGFSYEDRGRSGIIASKNPLLENLKKEAEKGKPILGICNGAQILMEAKLIPGLDPENVEMALAANKRVDENGNILGTGFYNDWIYIKNMSDSKRSAYNNYSKDEHLYIPVAHADGRFTTLDSELLEILEKNEQIVFKYCDENGNVVPEFPVNPNGSAENIAGICNLEGNVLSLMPHPERTVLGQAIFDSMKKYLSKSYSIKKSDNYINERKSQISEKIENFEHPQIEIYVDLIITDNEERTLEHAIHEMGYKNVKLRKQSYFGITTADSVDLKKTAEDLIKTGEIVNLAKEIPTVFINNKKYIYDNETGLEPSDMEENPEGVEYISFDRENIIGENIFQSINQHFSITGVKKIEFGKKWTLLAGGDKAAKIVNTHIFHNPHSMDMYIA
jgi:phosphoribosylformylglycinamidine synthase